MKTLSLVSRLLIFILLHLTSTNSFSQTGFTQVPPPGGSWGTGNIYGTQDPKGYMWFGAIGLHRYDGYNYKSYFNDPLDSSSLAFNRIQSILADRQGIIWVGTNGGGLDRLDPETGIFTHFRHNPSDSTSISNDLISVILEDREGKIWVGTELGGLNCLDPKTGKITRFRFNPNDSNSLSHDEVRALYEDHQGTIWIGTGFPRTEDLKWKAGGLNRFNRTDNNFTRFLHDPKDPTSLIDNRIWSIYEDSKDRFWVGTAGDGLHIMDREKGSFERYLYNAADPNGLSRPPVRNTAGWLDDLISFIREDAAGNLWIGTYSGGINRYDPESRKISHYTSLRENSTDKNRVTILGWGFISKDGALWVAGNDGVFRIDPLKKQIPLYDVGSPVTSIIQERSGKLWLGTNRGLVVYDSARINKKRFVHVESDTTSLSNNRVVSILEDQTGFLWIGTASGLNKFDHQSQIFTRYFPNSNKGNISMGSPNSIFSIYADPVGTLWLGTGIGLSSMNKLTGTFSYYLQNKYDSTSPVAYENGVRAMLENREGHLWTGTFAKGLNRFDNKTNTFKEYLPGFSIRSIFEDSSAVLWIGTNRGLYYFNPSSNGFVLFSNPGAGLEGNINVFNILEDDRQSLWINTSIGLFRVGHDRSEISFFGKSHGMIPSVNGSQNSCFKGIGGELFFGTGIGYYAFFPEQLKGNSMAPALNITGFRLGDQLVVPGKGSSLSEVISQTDQIRLPYNENVFSFDFAGIHYSSPEDNRHLFMLENLDNDWRKAGEEKTAYYYNVPPGNYIFRVKAASGDGVWAEKSIVVIISPPWWRTWWAYGIYGLLFVVAVWSIHRYQKQRIVRIEQEKAQRKELELGKEIEKAYHKLEESHENLKTTQAQLIQSEKMASLGELTAGIAHEIQNPLNFVNNFSDLNKELLEEIKGERSRVKGERNEELEGALLENIIGNEEKINHHGKRADAIVKSMLQHSSVSSGQKEMTDINALADEYLRLAYHGLRAKDKDFNANMKTEFDKSIGNISIIPQDIGRVLLNLFNNAFWACAERSLATVNEKKVGLKTEGVLKTPPVLEVYQPTVSVSTKKMGDMVSISVNDNGNGIPQKILDKIFQPFFTTKPTGQGTGLGLSLAYDMVKAHAGELKVESKEGLGTEFIILLPKN